MNVVSPYFSNQDFTRFKLSVNGESKRTPVAQGEETKEGENICFTNKIGLPGLTLCIGEYTRKSIREGGVLYEVFLLKEHEYLIPQGIEPESVIEYWTLRYKFSKDEAYVFDKLNLVETPVHFCAYRRDWKNSSEYVQPGIIYRPEREALFPYTFKLKLDARSNDLAGDFFRMYSVPFLDDTRSIPTGDMFFSQLAKRRSTNQIKNENEISFLLQKYHYNVYSSEFVGIDLVFRGMQQGLSTNFRDWGGTGSVQYFEDHSLEDALQNPNGDVELGRAIYSKSYNFLKYLLRTVPYQEFERFNSDFMERHALQCFSYESYCEEVEKLFGINLLDLTRQLYSERSLPAFYFREARVEVVELSNGVGGYVFSIKVWNKGIVEGLVSLNDDQREEWQNYVIPAGACKEIKTYFKGKSDLIKVELSTNLARNDPFSRFFEDFPEKNTIGKPIEGIFEADTLAFAPEVGVYIVDNEDPGFRVIEDSRMLEKAYKKSAYSYKGTRWDKMYWEGTYGELAGSFLDKISGEGVSAVEWEVNLPESGAYEVFVYNNQSFAKMRDGGRLGRGEGKAPIQTYRLTHSGGEEEVEITPLDAEQGWVSLGKYEFNVGVAKINLSGQGADQKQHVLADAVKWVKLK